MEAASTVVPAPPQHMRALAHANRVRLARAALKRAFAAASCEAATWSALPLGGRDDDRQRAASQPAPVGPHPRPQVPVLAGPERESRARHASPSASATCSPPSSRRRRSGARLSLSATLNRRRPERRRNSSRPAPGAPLKARPKGAARATARQRDRQPQRRRPVSRAAISDRDPDRAGEQRRVRAVAGEVLADRELEARRASRARGRRRSSSPPSGARTNEPTISMTRPTKHDQLDQRERAPWRGRPLVGRRLRRPRWRTSGCRLRLGRGGRRTPQPCARGRRLSTLLAQGAGAPRLTDNRRRA